MLETIIDYKNGHVRGNKLREFWNRCYSCEWRDVLSSKSAIQGSTLFNPLISVHRWLSLFNRKCLSLLPLLHSGFSVNHTNVGPVNVMRSISFKDMLSDGRFFWMIEPNCIPVLLWSYFSSSHRLPGEETVEYSERPEEQQVDSWSSLQRRTPIWRLK